MLRHLKFLLALGMLATPAGSTLGHISGLTLDPIFSDGMVLQRGAELAVTGSATPDTEVLVSFGSSQATTRAGADGRWRVTLASPEPGGGYALRASAGSFALRRGDILVGDVFLCSGQSNMAWPVRLALNPDRELGGTFPENIRLLKVPLSSSVTPLSVLPQGARWRPASRETVSDFSALCYFFGRDWQASERVPVGLIDASWGGSRIEAWISQAALRTVPRHTERLDLLARYVSDPDAGMAAFGALWARWWQNAAGTSPWRDGLDAPRPVPGALRDWKAFGDPEIITHFGMVWHERQVELTERQATGPARLLLGGIDEIDATWVNGRFIGTRFDWDTQRRYDLPDGTLRAGTNRILVNVQNDWEEGGMTGPEDALALVLASGERIALAGSWTYQKVPPELGPAPQTPWMSVSGVSGLHNAMLAPLAGLNLAGAIWYQGESNTHDADTYQETLHLLAGDLRRQFGAGLQLLVLQLPEFGTRMYQPGQSGWSALRDAQRRFVTEDDRAGLVVTLGAGDEWDIHPPNKQEIARRARGVWDVLLTDPASPARTGHSPTGARTEPPHIRIDLPDASAPYQTSGHHRPIGFMLCRPQGADCAFADARLNGSVIEIDTPYPDAGLVRYCWGDTPACNLMTPEGAPVTPFELVIDRRPE